MVERGRSLTRLIRIRFMPREVTEQSSSNLQKANDDDIDDNLDDDNKQKLKQDLLFCALCQGR